MQKKPAKKRASRAAKEIRLKAFWGVFNQSLKRVALFEQADDPGGCMRTEPLAEGAVYDPLATTFVLWVTGGAHGVLGEPRARGGQAPRAPR